MRNWISDYLYCQYKDGARGEVIDGICFHDCWSLARDVRHKVYGKRLLPSWGHIRNTMPRAFTEAYHEQAKELEECKPEIGALAMVFTGRLMLHVGVVVELEGRLAVLDISAKTGCRWQRVPDFEAPFAKVVYYRDSPNFPEPT